MKSRIGITLSVALAISCAIAVPALSQGAETASSQGSTSQSESQSSVSQSGSQSTLDDSTLARNAEIAEELANAQTGMTEDQQAQIQQTIEDVANNISERAFANLPTITTKSDGTKIQRTPATPDNGVTQNMEYDYEGWNTIYLNSEHRGCTSCHSSLADLCATMGGEPHTQLVNDLGIDIQVRQCVDCHSYCNVLYDKSDNFASIMHSLHGGSNEAFTNMGGDCMSCHYIESTGSYDQGDASADQGKFVLWDNVKYDLYRGITDVTSDDVVSQFNWDQTYTLSSDELFNKNFFHESMAASRKLSEEANITPDPETDGIYDSWEIEVSGDSIGNPFTMSISEMIDQFGLDTDTMTIFCDAGPIGTNLIGNYEITGISLKKIMDYAQVDDAATLIEAYAPNGHMYQSLTSLIDANDAYLVLEVDGEPLPYHSGYPVQLWIGGAAAWCNEKEVSNLNFVDADLSDKELFPDWFFNTGLTDESGNSNYKPGVGVFDLADGQVIDYAEGQAIHFSGYADAFESPITAVEFSFDGGQTWVSYDTPDATAKCWVHWELDWTPSDQGAYVFEVRAVDAEGVATAEPLKYLLNVQDPDDPIDVAAAQAQLQAEAE